MKTIFKPAIISLLIIIGITIFFTNCHKDKKCPLIVTVKMLGDTNKIVVNANVTVSNKKEGGLLQSATGLSDMNGQLTHTFDLEAIMDITAYIKDSLNDSIYGNAIVRLVPGQTVYKTVLIHK